MSDGIRIEFDSDDRVFRAGPAILGEFSTPKKRTI